MPREVSAPLVRRSKPGHRINACRRGSTISFTFVTYIICRAFRERFWRYSIPEDHQISKSHQDAQEYIRRLATAQV